MGMLNPWAGPDSYKKEGGQKMLVHYGARTWKRGRYRRMVATRIIKMVAVLIEGRIQPLTIIQLVEKTGYSKTSVNEYLQTVADAWPEKFRKQKRKGPHVKGRWRYVYFLDE